MNKFMKVLGVAGLLAISANASAINVGGVVWDPDHPLDFSGVTAVAFQSVDVATGELSGYGRITTLNGQGVDIFCPGCELTYQFDGFIPIGGSVLPSSAASIDYTGGLFSLYVDKTPDAPDTDHSDLTFANTGSDGGVNELWLSLAGHVFDPSGTTLIGTTTFNPFALTEVSQLSGLALLDVTGGLAEFNIDTDQMEDGSDIRISTSFSINVATDGTSAYGTGNFQGDSIPEPASLALLGLGLVGLGATRRRK